MELELGIAISLGVNVAAVAFMFGMMKASISSLKELLQQFKENIESDLTRLEAKQDKHNGLIERMVKVETAQEGLKGINEKVIKNEESTKSAHHRLDDFQKGEAC